jgi:N-acetylglucosaminyldiphosphoundecaprenol N-acetyl-beta-D-mannosaminyltransferase
MSSETRGVEQYLRNPALSADEVPGGQLARNDLPRPGFLTTARANVLGVGISAVTLDEAVRLSDLLIRSKERGYICVTGVHGVTEAQTDLPYRRIQNASFLTVPDGMPMVWVGRLQGFQTMRRVYGPDFMIELCKLSAIHGYRNFLYGGKPGVAERLRNALQSRIPDLQIVGTFSPPFGPLSAQEESQLISQVRASNPDVIWVGLSTPKQERFMAEFQSKLDTKLMVGVGAAFDIHIGSIKDAPRWMKNSGLQWLHRLIQEPRRLWRRYLINNPKFALKVLMQFAGILRCDMDA